MQTKHFSNITVSTLCETCPFRLSKNLYLKVERYRNQSLVDPMRNLINLFEKKFNLNVTRKDDYVIQLHNRSNKFNSGLA